MVGREATYHPSRVQNSSAASPLCAVLQEMGSQNKSTRRTKRSLLLQSSYFQIKAVTKVMQSAGLALLLYIMKLNHSSHQHWQKHQLYLQKNRCCIPHFKVFHVTLKISELRLKHFYLLVRFGLRLQLARKECYFRLKAAAAAAALYNERERKKKKSSGKSEFIRVLVCTGDNTPPFLQCSFLSSYGSHQAARST